MDLKFSKNKYDRYIYESIIKTCDELDLGEKERELFLKNYVEKKERRYEVQYKPIEGLSGPYRNKYLKGYSPLNRGQNYSTIGDALKALENDKSANGITLTRTGKYTIRLSKELLDSPINSNGSSEISWILENRRELKEKDVDYGDYEIISIHNSDYYLNRLNYKIYTMSKRYYGKLEMGKINKKK